MKSIISCFFLSLVPIIIGALTLITANGCKPEELPESAGQGRSTGCRLVNRTVTYTSSTPAYMQYVNWTYNANNMAIQYTNPQSIGQHPARVDFRYDENGYLTATTQVTIYSGIVGFVYDTLTARYEYANGRLVREVFSSQIYEAPGYNGIISYEYNSLGELTKIVDRSDAFGDLKTSVFSGGKLLDYAIIYDGTNKEVRPYQLNDGRITRKYALDRQYYTNYQYDQQGRPSRIEQVHGDRVTEYHTYAYADGKAHFDAVPLPKGWPTVTRRKFIYEELLPDTPILPVGLPVNWTRYKPTLPGSTELFKNIVKEYAHVKNEQGYPVRSEYTTTVYTSYGEVIGSPSRITETYTYAGCP